MSKISNEIVILDPRDIVTEAGFNTRYRDDLAPLKAGIKARGVMEAIHVRKDEAGNIILASQGHRRLAANLALLEDGITVSDNGVKLTQIPARYEDGETTPEERNLNIVIGNSGKPLELLEQGMVFRRVRDNAGEAGDAALKKAATETGLSIVHVRNAVSLTEQTEPTLRKLKADKISASAVVDIISGIRAEFPKIEKDALADKVEARVLKLVAKADEAGNGKKVSRSEAKAAGKVEGSEEAEKAAKEAELAAKARREEEKAELKRLKAIEARVDRMGAFLESKKAEDDVSAAAWNVLGCAYNFVNGMAGVKLSDIEGEVKAAQAAAKTARIKAVKEAKEGVTAKA